MLKIIVSPPGTGKTHYITEEIINNPGAVLIVPEQSHFETERMIYKKAGARIFCNTEILSFTKLAEKITADRRKPYVMETVREIIMLKAVRDVQHNFLFYRNTSGVDFAERMLGSVDTFQREGISHEELSALATTIENKRLKAKISDMAMIYEKYVTSLNTQFADKPDEIRVAANLAFREKYFAGKHIYIDGFDGFSGSQFLMIEAMLPHACSVTITFTADKENSTLPHYIIITKLIERLKNTAEKRKIKVFIQSSNLYPERILERNPKNNTEIYLLPNIYTESIFVAAKIRELITTENYSQNDIAVLNPPSDYVLQSAFSAYGLRVFSDKPEAIIEKPIIKFIITVLEAVQNKQGTMLDLIKSGFLRVSENAAFSRVIKINNLRKITGKRTYGYTPGKSYRPGREYIRLLTQTAREWQLDGQDWYLPFPKNLNINKAERIRAEITAKLSKLREKIINTTGGKITEALTDFLINEMEIPRTIINIIYKESKIDSSLNDEYRQLWETVISIFEAVYSALNEQEISVEDYIIILNNIFNKTMVAKPPQVLDAVTVGDLRRTRINDVKIVFIMGANQGEFPKNNFVGAEFSETETEELCRSGIYIEENRYNRYYRELYLINRAITLPSERLYITAPVKDMTGKEKKPARIITNASANLKKIPSNPSFWASHNNALKFLAAEKPHEYGNNFNNYKRDYLHKINKNNMAVLLKKNVLSPSRIETLNTCLFKYFCSQGIRIGTQRIKNSYEPDALMRGNLTHYVLENALKNNIDSDDFESITEKYIMEFEAVHFPDGWARSLRKKEILRAYNTGIVDVLRQIHEDMELSDFCPHEFEKIFSFTLGDVVINGKIDRVDVSGNLIRVIDYKTGTKQFNYAEIEYGLNMQALIYLIAVADEYNGFKPSGAFYRLVNGGKMSSKSKAYGAAEDSGNLKDLYKNRMETQNTTGLQFGEAKDITAINEKFKSKIGGRKNFINLENLSEEQFTEIAGNAAKQLREKLDDLYNGDVRAVPIYSKVSPCKHCDYKQLCGNAGKYEEIKIGG
jgi:ATP-dependent helicase/nuclease subunit B